LEFGAAATGRAMVRIFHDAGVLPTQTSVAHSWLHAITCRFRKHSPATTLNPARGFAFDHRESNRAGCRNFRCNCLDGAPVLKIFSNCVTLLVGKSRLYGCDPRAVDLRAARSSPNPQCRQPRFTTATGSSRLPSDKPRAESQPLGMRGPPNQISITCPNNPKTNPAHCAPQRREEKHERNQQRNQGNTV
jgi:hypothetical protein